MLIKDKWFKADKDTLCSRITQDIALIETTQIDGYERFYELAFMYDPYDYLARIWFTDDYNTVVTENICASGVETVTSMIAKQLYRAVFLPDQADFNANRMAVDLGRYSEGLAKDVRLDAVLPRIFKDAATFGTGLLRWEIDATGKLSYDRFLPVEVRVNEWECLAQPPRQMHLLKYRDREALMVKYPGQADEIERHTSESTVFGFGNGPADQTDQVLIRESYRLPLGTKGESGYRAGRKVVTTSTLVLLDEPYELPNFPVSVLRWSERTSGFMGKGLVEDLMGHQRTINKQNAAMDVQIDAHASPVTYVPVSEMHLVNQMEYTPIGRFVPFINSVPEVKIPPVIANEVMQRQEYLKKSYLEMSGISTMHSHGEMPLKRAETGAAVQELNDVTSERFSIQEQAAQRFYLDCIETMLMLVKANADQQLPTPVIPFSFGPTKRKIKWAKVDMADVRYQIQAAPQFSRTLSGRYQQIADWTNQGVITPDEARHLINHPDLDTAMSLFDAYRENVDRTANLLLDGEFASPDPRENLAMGLNWMLMYYFKAANDGAPEARLENMRTWMDQANFLLAKQAPPAPPPMAGPPPGAPPGGPMAAPMPMAA